MSNIHRPTPLRGDNFWVGKDGLDAGMYGEAATKGQTFSMFLEDLRAQKKNEASPYLGLTKFEVFQLREEMKRANQVIPMTAFEECLAEAGIKAFGPHTDYVGKFFEYSDTDVLFPDYFSDRVYAGMLKDSLVPVISMGETIIDGVNFHKIYIEDLEGDRQLAETTAGAELPEKHIGVSKQSIYLTKYGAYLTLTYEDVQYQRLNVFGKALELIGKQIDVDRTDEMIYILINGDGNSNSPGTTVQPAVTTTIGTADVIEWATGLPTPYKMNHHIGKKALLCTYYTTLSDFDNPVATWGFMGIDLPQTHEWDRGVISATDRIYGVDSRYAIEHVTTGAVLTESEKIIRKQINGTAISHRDAFSIFDKNAVGIWDTTF
ncbi:MAG: hypothetical protein PHX83_12110 [Acidobacteriia bacterium]|nr:hypothetical protein [Terriglobia bacterium]